jgi:transposase
VFDVLHADETHWLLMQKGGSKKWYVWALSMEDAVYCHLNASRSKDVARRLLDGYRGVALTDGYAAYQSMQGPGSTLRLVHCMAHVRRKFIEALPAYLQSQPAIDLIGQLYAVERTLPTLSGREGAEREQALALRLDTRKKESASVMKELHAWLTSQDALTKSLLHEALSYTLNLWPGLKLLLDEPRVPLDNNLCERDLRGVVSGRSLCVTPNPGPPGDSLRGEEAPVDARSPVG